VMPLVDAIRYAYLNPPIGRTRGYDEFWSLWSLWCSVVKHWEIMEIPEAMEVVNGK
jgi:hypothetical protein